ncbi:hypothetical protein JCM18237_13770 [Halorubrum luteum]
MGARPKAMAMRPRTLLALLLVVPFVDALFLVYVATRLGWTLTVALVVLTAILGMLLLRAEGRATLARVQRKLARGEPPTNELLDGGFLIASGALLLTPGLVTDGIGFLFAFPLTRVPLRAVLKKYVVIPYIDRQTGGFATGNVYIGGFPSGEEGFDVGGGFDPGSGSPGPDAGGPDSDPPDSGGSFGSADDADDIVDVDFTVEDEETDRSS